MSERTVRIGDEEITFRISHEENTVRLQSPDRVDEIEILSLSANEASLRVHGTRIVVPFARRGGKIWLMLRGQTIEAEVTPGRPRPRPRHGQQSMTAPMPGAVLKIFVAPGDVVSKGEPLIVLEAMKMEHQISAPYDGTVTAIDCAEGDLVQPGVDLIRIDPAEKE
ncbi:MAG: biotin/lipoyl-containing protein [Acidobacteriota bacterium]